MSTTISHAPISGPGDSPLLFPGVLTTADGSRAVVWVESNISQAAVAYPITPSTPMGDGFAVEFSNGKRNLWGEEIRFLEPESEHSSASACEGFALAGGRVTNFTSGQGLILMKEVLYVIAGKRLPVVFHVGARAITSQSLNIHCGHDDVMGVADCGWGMLFGRNAQEAADLALIARRAAEDSETPFFNVQDGFLTTHTLETVRLPELDLMREFAGDPSKRIRNLFDPNNPLISGGVQNQESYMTGRVAQRYFYERVRPALKAAMEEYFDLTGRRYSPIHCYRMEDAEFALIGLGSMMETAEATADALRAAGIKVGVISVTSYRPFPAAELAEALAGCRGATIIERTDVPLAEANPLTTEIRATLAGAFNEVRMWKMPEIYTAVAGLGGRDVRPGHFAAAVENMRIKGWRSFVLGVNHADALQKVEDPDVRLPGEYTLRGHSVGGFGSVTTNKILATVAADLFKLNVQAFARYGSEKKGLPTNYYLTLADGRIRLHAEPAVVDFVAIQSAGALASGDSLAGVRDGGTVYLQSAQPPDAVWAALPETARQTIRDRHLSLWVLDAARIAREAASRADLRIRMQGIALLGAFLRLSPFREQAGLDEEQLFDSLSGALAKYFSKQGAHVIAENLLVARRGFHEVAPVPIGPVPKRKPVPLPVLGALNGNPDWMQNTLVSASFEETVLGAYGCGRENNLEADLHAARALIPAATAQLRSFRNLALELPEFLPANCVGCMDCVNECPDTAILARVVEPSDVPAEMADRFAVTNKYHDAFVKRGEAGGLFGIFIDPSKCKGCGECVPVCGSHNALRMAAKAGTNLSSYDQGIDLLHQLPPTPARFINEKALGDMMLSDRSLLFTGGAGSCSGCGEGTAIRMLMAATGFVYGSDQIGVVASTGCNTVFGSTYPYNPYKIPWTNSLFENAPADAMGIRVRWDMMGQAARRLWVIGGDGAMYDIGFQSLSRMLMSGLDIKVLVLDTQVYSNTGGQSSTATFPSQNAKMAAFGKAHTGKSERRKEIAQIAMMHPGVFVAQTTAAHVNHFYKCVMAANEFPGPALVVCYAPCMPEHGIADDRAAAQAKLAVESRTFPVLVYDPRKGERVRERLSLQGNPSIKEDWLTHPKTGEPVDFVSFARTEGRFSQHFSSDGQPDEAILAAQRDRLANWRMLQELAGLH